VHRVVVIIQQSLITYSEVDVSGSLSPRTFDWEGKNNPFWGRFTASLDCNDEGMLADPARDSIPSVMPCNSTISAISEIR